MNNKSYDRITERIVSLLSQGTVPWHKPWHIQADIKVTRDLIRAGQLLKIELIDHVVIGNQNHSSLTHISQINFTSRS